VTDEAKLVDNGSGLVPEGEGWFVVNVRAAAWFKNERLGNSTLYQEPARAPELGVNLGVLQPGKPNCLYHAESVQEAFLVLDGECLLIVEGEERRLRTWDFFHCPAGTKHVFIGAEKPCVVLFIGARRPDSTVVFPVDAVARSHGASVEVEMSDFEEAYAGFPGFEPAPGPTGMPWNVDE
jgi:uncharacterized cupin superfamily protein